MNSLMTTIEVDRNAAIILQSLKNKADAQGVSLGELLQTLAQDEIALETTPNPAPRNEAMLEALRQTKELLKDQPVRGSTTETLKIIREARDGSM